MGATALHQKLLTTADGLPVEVINAQGQGPLVLVCEHASAYIPTSLNGLGLDEVTKLSHIAWDPGALALSHHLSAAFDAPLVASRISRLVYDCNRPPHSREAMRATSEVFDIPGNQHLTQADRDIRTAAVYQPFRDTLTNVLKSRTTPAALVTIHSFTPTYFGEPRKTELGLLHDADARLANAMLDAAPSVTDKLTERNKPYGPKDGVTYTLVEHAAPTNLLNVMIEVRNDLLTTDAQVLKTANILAKMIQQGLQACHDLPDKKSGTGPQT
jgi:predicted N-formylglutamate amidohydrolase